MPAAAASVLNTGSHHALYMNSAAPAAATAAHASAALKALQTGRKRQGTNTHQQLTASRTTARPHSGTSRRLDRLTALSISVARTSTPGVSRPVVVVKGVANTSTCAAPMSEAAWDSLPPSTRALSNTSFGTDLPTSSAW